MNRTHTLVMLTACLSLSACGDEGGSPIISNPVFDGGGFTPVTPGASCSPINRTLQCSCGTNLGVQTCGPTGFGSCVCAVGDAGVPTAGDGGTPIGSADGGQVPAGNLRTDIAFDWERSEPSPGTCEAGDYAGQFTGLYLPQAAYAAPIPVFDLENGDRPGLAFTLEQSENGEELIIQNGYVRGTANGLFPFDAVLTGTLDCKTATFTGELDGYYTIPIPFVEGPYSFRGPVTGTYDKNAHVFTSGTWNVTEYDPPTLLPVYGGSGDWNAEWLP